MKMPVRIACGLVLSAMAVPSSAQFAPQPAPMQPAAQPMNFGNAEVQTVVSARQSLDEFFGLSIESIPPAMLDDAEGVAIFPNMIKGGFILGVNVGKGVLHVRNPDRTWSPPVLVTMGGGSIGFQAGVQASDAILVFKTPKSLNGIRKGQKVTLGADASIAAGPVGRQASAGTDARLGAEVYSYARSRGLFAGVSLGGSDVSIDNNANAMLYGRFGVTPDDVFQNRGLAMRPEVEALIQDLNARTAKPAAAPVGQLPGPAAAASLTPAVPASQAPAARLSAVPPTQSQPLVPIAPAAPSQSLPLVPITPVTGAQTPSSISDPPLVPISPR